MSLRNDIELENTRAKLARLERRYAALRGEPCENHYVRGLTLRALKETINQFKEEIIRYEIGQRDRGQTVSP